MLSNDFPQLNEDKSETIVFGPPKLRNGLIKELGNNFPSIFSQVRNLGDIKFTYLLYLLKSPHDKIHIARFNIQSGP